MNRLLARVGFGWGVALAASPLGLAQTFPGAKSEPLTSGGASAASGFGPLLNVLLALGIVYALLRFGMPKVMGRLNRRLVTPVGSDIRIEESASFAGGSLYVVHARGRSLLLSVSSQGVQFLSDLTPVEKAPEPPTFGDFVERELRSQTAVVEPAEDRFPHEAKARPSRTAAPKDDPEADGISEALRRLERLSH